MSNDLNQVKRHQWLILLTNKYNLNMISRSAYTWEGYKLLNSTDLFFKYPIIWHYRIYYFCVSMAYV